MGLLSELMGAFNPASHDQAQQNYQQVYQQPHHEGSLSHEAIAGAAGFAAMHACVSPPFLFDLNLNRPPLATNPTCAQLANPSIMRS